jgi:DNA-binding Lrp family transcriptional regulator
MATALDDVDRRIVAVLQADGRLSVNELASRVGVARATAYQRLERLRSNGVITGFHAAVDPQAMGLQVTALVLINVAQGEWRHARDAIGAIPGAQYLALTSGGFDMVLLVRVPDVQTLRDVVLVQLHGLKEVRSTQTVFVLDEHGRLT